MLLNALNITFLEKKRQRVFQKVLLDELGISSINTDEHCDIVIIGSDEVFNCTQPGNWYGFSPNLFGQELNAGKVISYAASFGQTKLEDLKKYCIDGEVGKRLRSFAVLSVRDQNSYEIVSALTDKSPECHLDPVLIGEFDERVPKPKDTDYIAVYAYANRINDRKEIAAIKEFAKKRKLKIISVGMYQVWCDKNIIATPFEIVGYIKHAKYVITDTFHGCVFSIKYQKRFAAFSRETNSNKLLDLLYKFDLQNRLVQGVNSLEVILRTEPNTNAILAMLENEQNRSRNFLRENLS